MIEVPIVVIGMLIGIAAFVLGAMVGTLGA